MKKLDQKNVLFATGSMLVTLAICHSVSVQASDIDIYSNSTGGQTRIMFVLDTSSSMRSAWNQMGCDAPDDSTVNTRGVSENISASTVNGVSIPAYTRYKCNISSTTATVPKSYNYKSETITTLQSYKCPNNVSSQSGCTNITPVASVGAYECNESSGNTTYYFNTDDSRNRCNRGSKTYVFKTVSITSTNYYTCNSPKAQQSDCPTGTALASKPSGADTFLESTGGFSYYGTPAQITSNTRDIYDRITKLKEGMFDVLIGRNDVIPLGNDIVAGLTIFNTASAQFIVRARRLDISAASLSGTAKTDFENECGTASTTTQRSCLVSKIAGLSADDYTPTGVAYGVGAKSLLETIGTDTSTCNGNGIYFLTDGGPSGTELVAANSTQTSMSQAITGFTCPSNWDSSPTSSNSTYEFKSRTSTRYDNEQAWKCIAKFTQTLLAGATNRGKIKTATVGFGKFYEGLDPYTKDQTDPTQLSPRNIDIQNILTRYSNISNVYAETQGGASQADIANTALWGVYGRGGWYSASEPAQVAQSILNFVDDVKPTFDPIATGSPTLPQDALNPLRIQPYGYYASFIPKPQETTQPLWTGNLNKYHVYNGELYNNAKTIRLIKSDGSLDSAAEGQWTGGMTAKLPLRLTTDADNVQTANRKIYTNRQITGTTAPYFASKTSTLQPVNVTTLFGSGSAALFVNDPDKNYWLNLLGYDVGATGTVTLADLAAKPELRQIGAVMHSKPVLLTQRGKITVDGSGELDTTDRDDYLLFGTTQGLLHVIDAMTGVEKFTFAPHEMMQRQKAAFLSETSRTGTPLFYGVDAPWTAYTQYVAKADGTLTVKSSDRTSDGGTNSNLALKGLQWVYGGLRMGGRSYYALNLTDLDNPSLKFHIDPDAAMTTNATTGAVEVNTSNAISYMGQSWSKPTIAYVKFGGVKKLVMFVGGGYDAGYENAAYNQTNGIGAGVYMFDANDGSLLWWTSANATAAKGAEAYTNASATTISMKYSVVSQINAIDRDNDGLVDNLYFGDLGGQAFRVDLNNAAIGTTASDKKANFAKRVVRLFSENVTTGASPRFYEMPSVSIHEDNGYVAAVAFSSGNRSSPLVGAVAASGRNNQAGSTVSAADGLFVVYDKDVAKTDLYASPTLTTQNISFSSLNTNISTGVPVTGNNGWKYIYSNTAGVYKGMNELYALDGILFVNVYHRDGAGVGGSCGAGVKGDSYIYQFCLPTGKCDFATTTANMPNNVKIGAGILGSGLGQEFGGTNSKLVVPRPSGLDCTTTANKNKPECQQFNTTAKIRQLRWYETR